MIFEKTFGRLDRDAVADAGEGHVVGQCTSAVTCASALATSHTPQVANR